MSDQWVPTLKDDITTRVNAQATNMKQEILAGKKEIDFIANSLKLISQATTANNVLAKGTAGAELDNLDNMMQKQSNSINKTVGHTEDQMQDKVASPNYSTKS